MIHAIWMVLATAHPVTLLSVGGLLGFNVGALAVLVLARRAGRL